MHLFVAVGFFVVIHLHDIYAFRRRFYPKRLMGGGLVQAKCKDRRCFLKTDREAPALVALGWSFHYHGMRLKESVLCKVLGLLHILSILSHC